MGGDIVLVAADLVAADMLTKACVQVLEKVGVPRDQAEMIAQVVVEGDLRGVESQGVLRLPVYVHRVQAGLMAAATQLKVVQERGDTVLLDAQGGFGQVAGICAMNHAIERARKHGIGVAAVQNTNHFGIAAYYAMLALPYKMVGMVATNEAPSIAAWGGISAVLGLNPICVAIPTGQEVDVVLDLTSSIADGYPKDPQATLEEALLPIGGAKGYGPALVADVLAEVLTDLDYGVHLTSIHDLSRRASVDFVMQAIDITAFVGWAEYEKDIQSLIGEIRDSPRVGDVDRFYLPGEVEWLKWCERSQSGIPVPAKVLEQLQNLAFDVGAAVDLPLSWLPTDPGVWQQF